MVARLRKFQPFGFFSLTRWASMSKTSTWGSTNLRQNNAHAALAEGVVKLWQASVIS